MVAVFLKFSLNKFTHKLEIDNSAERFYKLLIDFFEYYSLNQQPISLLDISKISLEIDRFKHDRSALTILQSVYPYHNTARTVNDQNKNIIFKEINRALRLLKESNSTLDNVCKKLEINDYDHKISFKIKIENKDILVHIFTLLKAKILGLVTNLHRVYKEQEIRAFTDLDEENNYHIGLNGQFEVNERNKQMVLNYCNNFIQSIKSLSHTSEFDILLETDLL